MPYKEKVKVNNQEFEIQLLPSTLQTDNTTTTPKPVVRAQDLTKVVRQVPSVTQLPRWEDGTDGASA